MTYFLEKMFGSQDEKGEHLNLVAALIRPCEFDYAKVLKLFNHELPSDVQLNLGGCIANLNLYNHTKTSIDDNDISEWLVKTSLERGIIPDFETHIKDWESIIKTIDLHTGKTIKPLKMRPRKKISIVYKKVNCRS